MMLRSAEPETKARDIPAFAERFNISVSTAYKAARLGHLRITKVYGRALVMAEDEAAFAQAMREGKLVTPADLQKAENEAKTRNPDDPPRPPARRGRKPKFGSSPLRAEG